MRLHLTVGQLRCLRALDVVISFSVIVALLSIGCKQNEHHPGPVMNAFFASYLLFLIRVVPYGMPPDLHFPKEVSLLVIVGGVVLNVWCAHHIGTAPAIALCAVGVLCAALVFGQLVTALDGAELLMHEQGWSRGSKAAVSPSRRGHDAQQQLIESCMICLTDFGTEDDVVRCPTRHVFHHACATAWFSKGGSGCPLRCEPLGRPAEQEALAEPLLAGGL